jgi:hypothetical protein
MSWVKRSRMLGALAITAAVGVMGLDTQGRVWYGELSGAPSPARYSIKWTRIEEKEK